MKMAPAAFRVLPVTLATRRPGRSLRHLGDQSWTELRISGQIKHFSVPNAELTAMISEILLPCCL